MSLLDNDHSLTIVTVVQITVTQFKAKCLGIIEKVEREKCRVVISRHGRPAAELVPVRGPVADTFWGRAADRTTILGDLISSEEDWDAEG